MTYSQYKDSDVEWIGEIPAGWDIIKLKFISRVISGATPKTSVDNYWGGEINWISPKDIGKVKDDKFLHSTARSITYDGLSSCACSLTPKGSVVVTNRAPIGNVIIPAFDFTTNQGCKSITCCNSLSSVLIYYLLKVSKNFLESFGQGTTFMELSNASLENYLIPYPPLQEQQQIAKFLDHKTQQVDSLIEKIEQKIELLKEQRTALINQVVTKGLDPDAEMKDSGVEWIGEIPAGWRVSSFKYAIKTLTDFSSNGSFKSLADNVQYLEKGYSRLVRLTDLRSELKNSGIYVSKDSHDFLSKSELFGGEILIASVGHYTGIGIKMFQDKGVCTLGPNMYLLRNQIKIAGTDYLLYQINSIVIQVAFSLVISSTAQPKINKDNLKNVNIIYAPLQEQQEIVDYLDRKTQQIDSQVEKETERVELLKEYRNALISEVVTGKLDVREEQVA